MRAVFRYPGSKWSIARWIISHFPAGYEKMVYLEPFVGSGAVFFNKKPSALETINDLDSNIVNLFRVLRDDPDEMRRVLQLTPYSREEYDRSFEPCDEPKDMSKFRRTCHESLCCESCAMYRNYRRTCGNFSLTIDRPPKSWLYVEEMT